MSIRIRAVLKPEYTDVRVLVSHPMETGLRRDDAGKLVPLHFIQTLVLRLNGQALIQSQLSQAVSRNPVFAFRLRQAKVGDKIELAWTDNQGASGRADALVSAN